MISTTYTRRNVLAALMALALAAAVCIMAPAVAHADEGGSADGVELQTQGAIAKGKWGTCKWTIDAKGVLTVNPGKATEPSPHIYDPSVSPWDDYCHQITKVVFKAKGAKKVVAPVNCSDLLHGMYKMESIDLSGLDTSRAQRMDNMFVGCMSLKSLDLSGLDTSQVASMNCAFSGCQSLKSLKLSGLDTSRLRYASSMFVNCASLKSVRLSGLDTSQLEHTDSMFKGCSSLKSLDLSGLDTSQIRYASSMFDGCSSLKSIYASGPLGIDSVAQSTNVFSGCKKLVGGNGTKYSEKHVDAEYARIDKKGQPGYFTYKAA